MQGLYLVTPNWDDTARLLAASEEALAAGAGRGLGGAGNLVALLQYRHKEAASDLRLEQASALLALCRRHGVPFIVNDFVDLCRQTGADGVHLGGTDADVAQVRGQLGADKIIGASCYGDMPRALAAQRAGASYVAFGGFYPSRVKQYAVTTRPAILDQARAAVTVPTVVIGGMTPDNAAPLVARGAGMVAAISSVYQAASVRGAVDAFTAMFAIHNTRKSF
ncbi:thiamine-phosphate pyrophosphorylase [Duganella sp. CF517]|uniref:thiamine phosphate synthase n=1 Tax=Duganella sp. CF517 TaxID=1881038 RepID=UPI0008C4F589|nr:thiamine phosphate synthase [Duganella sp. CF517]SEN63171.1 thiamine-phosphate pyrophosphorylase [Duganella sp. CF517]